MTIYETLKNDHDRHRDLMQRILDTEGDSEERRELFATLVLDVEAHAAAEEQTLYSELIESVDGQPQTRHSVAEHKESSDLLARLQEMDMSSPAWLETFKTYRHDLEHHMSEEESDVFALSESLIEDERATELAGKFEGRKQIEERRIDA